MCEHAAIITIMRVNCDPAVADTESPCLSSVAALAGRPRCSAWLAGIRYSSKRSPDERSDIWSVIHPAIVFNSEATYRRLIGAKC